MLLWDMEVPLSKEQKIRIANSKDIFLIMRQILRRENKLAKQQEHFWIVGLTKSNRILYIELMGLGGKKFVNVSIKQVLKIAIYKDAESIIAVHNHPTGTLRPSEADEHITQYLKHGGNFVEIKLKDHLIISEKGYFSFKDKKLL
ncbi:MAG TPA: JAB domain-containing protein [Bacteroidia bacterium]|nr:JAB domain-containing protein [Bacteroidia bacterium]